MEEYISQAENDLRLLNVRKQAIQSKKAQIRMVEADAYSLSSSGASAVPIRGGGNQQEARLCGMIDRKDKLRREERALRDIVRATERALAALSDDERDVLKMFYIGERLPVREMEERLHISRAGVYRLRERALLQFARLMGHTG